MEILSSRVLLRPQDLERSLRFYEDTLDLAVYREWGQGKTRGVVFFLGCGLPSTEPHRTGSGRRADPSARPAASWAALTLENMVAIGWPAATLCPPGAARRA